MEGTVREQVKPAIDVPHLTDDKIAEAAQDLRSRYYEFCGESATSRILPQNVVWDFLDSEEHVSLDIESELGLTKEGAKIAGQMVVCDEGGIIRVDAAVVSKPLYPFTLSHEIGHWVLHRIWVVRWLLALQACGDTTTEFLTLNQNICHKSSTQLPSVEWQSNRFAVHLLTPSSLVEKEFRRIFGRYSRRYADQSVSSSFVQQHPNKMNYARFMAHGAQSPTVQSMSKVFGTSVECMAIRLQELELV